MTESARSVGGETRREVLSLLLKHGPITAAELGERLQLSAAGVRRHLDKLIEDNLAETSAPRPIAGEEPTRGRPAKLYQLTEQGRECFGSDYCTLASEAIDILSEIGGDDAVRALARKRIDDLLDGVQGVADSGSDIETVARDLAAALDRGGFAATVTPVGNGLQLCQHHCPVVDIAAAHPEMCEAEHEAISTLVGTHVQPLASLVDGHGICTTHIPLAAVTRTLRPHDKNTERSGDLD